MNITPSRKAAFDILFRIEKDGAFSSILLPAYGAGLDNRDRGLCYELTLGVLRRKLYLNYLVDSFTSKSKLDIEVRIALWLGLYQLLFLDRIPKQAATNESVNLVKRAKKVSAAGFVNAILIRASRERLNVELNDELERLSIETSHPRWLLERWIKHFGKPLALEIANVNNKPAPAGFRILDRNLKIDQNFARKSRYVNNCYVAQTIAPELVNLASEGKIYFQDEASQLVAQAVDLDARSRLIDICAAPGGKVTQITRRRNSKRPLIFAGDKYSSRVAALSRNCKLQNVAFVDIVQYDAEQPLPFADETFDSVLVDAPCSGTGTIRQNPEIRYRATSENVAQLASKQRRILQNASKVVSKGGSLIYSTCSLEQEENEDVCRWFLKENKSFAAVRPDVPERFLTNDLYARTFPHRDDMEGFFIAAFTKN